MKKVEPPLVDIRNADVQKIAISSLAAKGISVDVLRLDKLHPVISGNKWFKLKYYLEDAVEKNHKTILTFGGAWSNHIIAAACAARQSGLHSIGIIRGEAPSRPSLTLRAAIAYGMELRFTDRVTYASARMNSESDTLKEYGDAYFIPEAGAGKYGIKGSTEILNLIPLNKYSHIVCCIGSGTMYTGLANALLPGQHLTGITVLKGMNDLPSQLLPFIKPETDRYCNINEDYHFGGYAKKTPGLLQFMNWFYQETGIPTDFVYTAKLFYACTDLIAKDYFPKGSTLLVIHSGGLQGNASLPADTLLF